MVGTEGEIFVVLGETRYVLVWAGGGGWNFRFLQLRNYALLWLLGDSCVMLMLAAKKKERWQEQEI